MRIYVCAICKNIRYIHIQLTLCINTKTPKPQHVLPHTRARARAHTHTHTKDMSIRAHLHTRARTLKRTNKHKHSRNIIEWRDHRAHEQADRINQGSHKALEYVGGKMSLEQQPPKLMWIKENLPDTWQRACKTMDVADFMVGVLCAYMCTYIYVNTCMDACMRDHELCFIVELVCCASLCASDMNAYMHKHACVCR